MNNDIYLLFALLFVMLMIICVSQISITLSLADIKKRLGELATGRDKTQP